MTHPRQQSLVDRMRVLQRSSPEVEAAALISLDGLIIASALKTEDNVERISAMSASLLSLAEGISKETNRGSLDELLISGAQGHLVLMSVGDKAVLTALVTAQAKMGILLMDMRHAANDLNKILDQED